jgi:hypothetical protein
VLKAQKALTIFAILRRENDPTLSCLQTCLPGSGRGFQRLREIGYDIKPAQMEQVVDSVASRMRVTKMKAEEMCCKGLKMKDQGQDCNRPNQPLYKSLLTDDGVPRVDVMEARKEQLPYIG